MLSRNLFPSKIVPCSVFIFVAWLALAVTSIRWVPIPVEQACGLLPGTERSRRRHHLLTTTLLTASRVVGIEVQVVIDGCRESFLFSLEYNVDKWAWRDARLGRLDVWNVQWWKKYRTSWSTSVHNYWTASHCWVRVIVWDLLEVLDFFFGLMFGEDSGRVVLLLWRMRRRWLIRSDQNILLGQRHRFEANLLLVVLSGAVVWTCVQVLQVSRRVATMLGRSRSTNSWRHPLLLFLLFGYESSGRNLVLKRCGSWRPHHCRRVFSAAFVSCVRWPRHLVHVPPAFAADLSLFLCHSVHGLRLWFSRVHDLYSLLIRFLRLNLRGLFSFDRSLILLQSCSPFASLWLLNSGSLWSEYMNRFFIFFVHFRCWFWLDLDWRRPSLPLMLWSSCHR